MGRPRVNIPLEKDELAMLNRKCDDVVTTNLARQLGISGRMLNYIRKGVYNPDDNTAEKIRTLLGKQNG